MPKQTNMATLSLVQFCLATHTHTHPTHTHLPQVFFQPMSNTIITCFKDDSIHAWETDTLDYKYQIPPPFGPTPHYRAFATPQDGRLLVAGGRSSYLHVWSMESRQLLRVIQLPPKIRVVKQLVFLPDSFDGGSSEVSLRVGSCERYGRTSLE